jgi:hypothetical protein
MIEVRGIDGTEDPVDGVRKYLEGLSREVQSRALLAGVSAYIKTVQKAAAAGSPFPQFKTMRGYRSGEKITRAGIASGYVYSAAPGNIIESGNIEHFAYIPDTVSKYGNVWPGLGRWMQAHAPDVWAVWKRGRNKIPLYAKTRARAGTPWVIPIHSTVEGAAIAAFEEAVIEYVARRVT